MSRRRRIPPKSIPKVFRRALSHVCPKCGAGPGLLCQGPKKESYSPHQERLAMTLPGPKCRKPTVTIEHNLTALEETLEELLRVLNVVAKAAKRAGRALHRGSKKR